MKGDPFQRLCLPAGSPYTRKRILSRDVSLFLLLTTLPPQSLPPACDPLSPLSPSSSGSSGKACSSTAASPRGPAASSPLDTVLVTDCGGAGCASFCRRALISLRSMRTRRVRAPLDRIALTRSSFSSSSFSCASGDRWARFSGMRMLSTAREKRTGEAEGCAQRRAREIFWMENKALECPGQRLPAPTAWALAPQHHCLGTTGRWGEQLQEAIQFRLWPDSRHAAV